jgi:hypothetical protein
MKPKLVLWAVFALISSAWYALDPDASGPLPSPHAHAQGAPAAMVIAVVGKPQG